MSATNFRRPRRSLVRRAFTLIEILTSLAILGIIGIAFVRLITSQARFTEGQMAGRNARTVSRNAMNIMLTDLRMVQDSGGLLSAARDSVTVRIPVAFGLLCGSTVGLATMQILPVDSAMTEFGYYSGWAYRDSVSGLFNYQDALTPVPFNTLPAGNTNICTDSAVYPPPTPQGPGILPMSYTTAGGATRSSSVIKLGDPVTFGTPNAGWPVFLYQQITYKFDSSVAYPHRVGLFRKIRSNTVGTGMVVDEIIAPFDTSARFRFYVLNGDAAQDAPPAALKTVRGLELVLAGSSPRSEQGKKYMQEALVTGVFFKNRRDP
ncbi:MAG TPA: type II secretion system protein [Gemmatimonadaceae bacterium]|nr:type II secretion system protein [Gemmatimonadaceae bacterium]